MGKPRKLDAELREQIRCLKSNYPRMPAAAIYRQLHENGSIKKGDVSESTVNRYIKLLALELKTTTNQDMRRYERPHINEVWCGDSSVGPYLRTPDGKKHKVWHHKSHAFPTFHYVLLLSFNSSFLFLQKKTK